ncbi:hypothetical protein VTL71DRAFT_6534 [Oculimacula yallundae]|uniref:Acetoacetate decarboxylase n=1 Tax=Oculimacula yallundae TaxID=86028 RepID=A0ABR4BXA6_9HELO
MIKAKAEAGHLNHFKPRFASYESFRGNVSGLLFPVNEDRTRLIYIDRRSIFHGARVLQTIRAEAHPFFKSLNPSSVVIKPYGPDPKAPKIAIFGETEMTWKGSLLSIKVIDLSDSSEPGLLGYYSINPMDMYHVTEYLLRGFLYFESPSPSPYMDRLPGNWSQGVAISCDGDVLGLGKERYRQVQVRSSHRIFDSPGLEIPISSFLGIPLLFAEFPPFSDYHTVKGIELRHGPLGNVACHLLLSVN